MSDKHTYADDKIKKGDEENTNSQESLLVRRLRLVLENDLQVGKVLNIIDSICECCWDSDRPCTCMKW